jgi:hypothetical protein
LTDTVRAQKAIRMDKGKAISRFMDRVDRFSQIDLITDQEMRDLFGEEIMELLGQLELLGREERLCELCGGKCCADIGCELFSSHFGQCPIHSCRPIACRLHFCYSFDNPYKSAIIDLRDVFFGCFRGLDLQGSANIGSLDMPPFNSRCSGFLAAVAPLIESVRQGKAVPQNAAKEILKEAYRFRDISAWGQSGS